MCHTSAKRWLKYVETWMVFLFWFLMEGSKPIIQPIQLLAGSGNKSSTQICYAESHIKAYF